MAPSQRTQNKTVNCTFQYKLQDQAWYLREKKVLDFNLQISGVKNFNRTIQYFNASIFDLAVSIENVKHIQCTCLQYLMCYHQRANETKSDYTFSIGCFCSGPISLMICTADLSGSWWPLLMPACNLTGRGYV